MNIRYYQGERIDFRPLEIEDEPLLRFWVNDPENWATLGRFAPLNALREREFIEKLYKNADELALGICVRDGHKLIGVCGLHGVGGPNRNAEFGILIGDCEYQSQGFGTEAARLMVRYGFEELNLNRIGLSVFADNGRAVRSYEKAGFVREGCRRQAYYRNGRYHDELIFGLLREEGRSAPAWKENEIGDR